MSLKFDGLHPALGSHFDKSHGLSQTALMALSDLGDNERRVIRTDVIVRNSHERVLYEW
jgi:hypothetical protein